MQQVLQAATLCKRGRQKSIPEHVEPGPRQQETILGFTSDSQEQESEVNFLFNLL